MQTRRQYILFFGLIAAVIAAAFVLGRPRQPALLDAVPKDAWLVVTVDVRALRQSPLAKPLLGGGGEKPMVPGLAPFVANCGFDPVAKLAEVAVTSPENGERGEFGVVFTGDFTKDELVACANGMIKAHGGSPTTATRGSFTVVEDTGDTGHARVAYREGGPYLVGRGAWLNAMIDAADGKGERMRPELGALREALRDTGGNAKPAGAARAVVLTALLPAALRDRLKSEMAAEAATAGEDGKPNPTFAAVLGVTAAGIALTTGAEGSTTEIAAQLQCESAAACEEVKRFVERKRLAFSKELTVRLLGLGPLLDSVAVEAKGPLLTASARASSDDLAHGLQRAIDFTSRRGPPMPGLPGQAGQGGAPPAPATSR